ncbi:MAG: MBOAT family O-acyltransferase [Muribaculaceae bacterium]
MAECSINIANIDWSSTLDNVLNLFTYSPGNPMLFSSGLFWALFLIFLPVYAMIKHSRTKMMIFTTLFSLFFYYKSGSFAFCLLLFTAVTDWLIALKIHHSKPGLLRKTLLWTSIILSLSILGYFKYANFFVFNWSMLTNTNFQPLDIILPIGISYYTFRSISYVADVYNGKISPATNLLEYVFFLSFFPALVAGPIVRAEVFLPQLRENKNASKTDIYTGLWLIILGIAKKAIIADYICQYNDLIFSTPTGYSGFETLMGVLGYTAQIYCDFSGYSDMAIGMALIMGFHIPDNFNFPYKSTSLTEFWRRWHISLSTWLRDYLYIPLGGNRKGKYRTYINNFITMLLGGLWHGAAWKFIFWGGMHGAGLAVNKACRPFTSKIDGKLWFTALSWLITMATVSFLWIFFRADSWEDSWSIICNIFTNFSLDYFAPFAKVRYTWLIMMAVVIITHSFTENLYNKITRIFVSSPWIVKLLIFTLVIQLVIEFAGEDVPPFIYFQF